MLVDEFSDNVIVVFVDEDGGDEGDDKESEFQDRDDYPVQDLLDDELDFGDETSSALGCP